MEERLASQNHHLILKNRETIQLTGVVDVISFDNSEIILETARGMLMIKGEELHMNHLTVEKGEVHVEGKVDSFVYSDSHKGSKQAGKLMERLFK